jgi:hypothetical protein
MARMSHVACRMSHAARCGRGGSSCSNSKHTLDTHHHIAQNLPTVATPLPLSKFASKFALFPSPSNRLAPQLPLIHISSILLYDIRLPLYKKDDHAESGSSLRSAARNHPGIGARSQRTSPSAHIFFCDDSAEVCETEKESAATLGALLLAVITSDVAVPSGISTSALELLYNENLRC